MAGTSAFSHEIPVGGCYLHTSPSASAVGVAGWADFPLSSVLGLIQLPNARHVPEAAATESGTGRHCLVSHALLMTKFTGCSRIPLTVPGMHNLAQSCVKKPQTSKTLARVRDHNSSHTGPDRFVVQPG